MKQTIPLAGMVLFVAAFVTSTNRLRADLIAPEQVRSQKECPDGLHVTAKQNNGMIDVVVRIDPDKVQHNELNKRRATAICHLDLSVGKDRVAYAQLKAKADKKHTVFWFKISAAAARSSHLDVNTYLSEKTVGGGKTLQIYLTGFLPSDQQSKRKQ